MNNKDKSNHAAKAATKAAIYEDKAAEDKADVRSALNEYFLSQAEKKPISPILKVSWKR